MRHPFAAVFAILFLLAIAVVSYLLLTKPLAVAEFATNKGFVVAFLELTRTKWGRIQVRLLGLVFLVVSIFMMVYIVLQLALGRGVSLGTPIVFGLRQVKPTASLPLRIWFTVVVIAPIFFGLLMVISPVRASALQYWLLGLGRSNEEKEIRMLHSSEAAVLWYRIPGVVFLLAGLVYAWFFLTRIW